MGATGLIYEPLIQFDLAAPPKYYPWLATSYAWSNGGKTITFTIRQGVKWNNGTPLTPADVAFTFDMVKANTAINSGGLTISSVSTSGNTVTLTFPTSQYTNLEEIAGTGDRAEVALEPASTRRPSRTPNPVGTGPYMLGSFTPQGFTLKKNPYYWQACLRQGPERLLPGLHLQHRRAQRAVQQPDRLDRELHPRPAEELRRHRPGPPQLLGGGRRRPRASSRT